VPTATQNIAINANQYLVDKLDRGLFIPELIQGGLRYKLPYKLYGMTPSGTPLDLDIAIDVLGGGMNLTQDASGFIGSLEIGIIDNANPAATELGNSRVTLGFSTSAGRLDPDIDSITIEHTNLPFARVNLVNEAPAPVTVRIRSSISHDIDEITLDVKTAIDVKPSPEEIDGLGLGTAGINVQIKSLTEYEGLGVTLTTNKGRIENNNLSLDKQNRASTRIRSIGLGTATITATSGAVPITTTSVDFVVPWFFLLFTLAGGLIGASIRLLMTKSKNATSVVRRLARGVFVAIVVTAGYAIGVILTPLVPEATAGEALMFVLAAIGSYIGKITLPESPKG